MVVFVADKSCTEENLLLISAALKQSSLQLVTDLSKLPAKRCCAQTLHILGVMRKKGVICSALKMQAADCLHALSVCFVLKHSASTSFILRMPVSKAKWHFGHLRGFFFFFFVSLLSSDGKKKINCFLHDNCGDWALDGLHTSLYQYFWRVALLISST